KSLQALTLRERDDRLQLAARLAREALAKSRISSEVEQVGDDFGDDGSAVVAHESSRGHRKSTDLNINEESSSEYLPPSSVLEGFVRGKYPSTDSARDDLIRGSLIQTFLYDQEQR
ncbi:unnamed protein product, partial [Amoebophrya sp. A25]